MPLRALKSVRSRERNQTKRNSLVFQVGSYRQDGNSSLKTLNGYELHQHLIIMDLKRNGNGYTKGH
jgi:hypothetical protein